MSQSDLQIIASVHDHVLIDLDDAVEALHNARKRLAGFKGPRGIKMELDALKAAAGTQRLALQTYIDDARRKAMYG